MRFDKKNLTLGRLILGIIAISIGYNMAWRVLEEHYYEDMEEDDFRFALKQFFPDSVTCYEEVTDDEFWEQCSRKYGSTNLYFHFPQCWYTVKLAHLCAVEAASRAYRYGNVYMLFCKPLQFSMAHTRLLNEIQKKLPRLVKCERIVVETYFDGTPFENKINSFLNNGLVRKHKRLEETLKLTTLYLNGGIVVDTDVIVTDIPDIPAKHWLIREKNGSISSSMFSFKSDKTFCINESIPLFEETFKNYTLSAFLTNQHNMCLRNGACKDIKVVDKEIVDVKYSDKAQKIPPAFAYRVVDEILERRFPNNSLLGEIAKKYCPYVYSQSYLFE